MRLWQGRLSSANATLDRLQRRLQFGSGADYAAAVADGDVAIALGIARRQGGGLGRADPEPQQIAPALGLGPVFIVLATVQQGMIVDELHIAGLQFHPQMNLRVVGNFFDQGEGFVLQFGEAWHFGKTLDRADVFA